MMGSRVRVTQAAPLPCTVATQWLSFVDTGD
jgi:hypothetical protein